MPQVLELELETFRTHFGTWLARSVKSEGTPNGRDWADGSGRFG